MATTAIPRAKISGGSFLLEERSPSEVFTPEDFTEQHNLIGQTAEEFAVNEILPNIEKIEHKDFSVTRDLLKKAGELGLSGVEIPEAYGGLEMDKVTGCRSSPTTLPSTLDLQPRGVAIPALVRCPSFISAPKTRRRMFPRLAAGEIVGAYALSEASSGSDAMNCRTKATLSPRWQALHSQRRKDVDHQCRNCRSLHGLCQDRRGEVFGVSGRANFARDCPWAQKSTSWGFADRPLARSF